MNRNREIDLEREEKCNNCYWYWDEVIGRCCHCEMSVHNGEYRDCNDVCGFYKVNKERREYK